VHLACHEEKIHHIAFSGLLSFPGPVNYRAAIRLTPHTKWIEKDDGGVEESDQVKDERLARFHERTLIIYKLGFNKKYYTFT
jgi:hypothetical protein